MIGHIQRIYQHTRVCNRRCCAAKQNDPIRSSDNWNGKIYVIGGFDSSGTALDTLEAYDPSTNGWDPKKSMPEAKGFCGALADNEIYVIGGNDGYGSVNTVFKYNLLVDI